MGSLGAALARRLLGGESLFLASYLARQAGELVLSPSAPGDVAQVDLDEGASILLRHGAFLAAEETVRISASWVGLSSWLGGEGLVRLLCSGPGRVWFSGLGGIDERALASDQELIVDGGHLIAVEAGVQLRAGLPGRPLSSLLSGEGGVCWLKGPGRAFLQTRTLGTMAAWLNGRG